MVVRWTENRFTFLRQCVFGHFVEKHGSNVMSRVTNDFLLEVIK